MYLHRALRSIFLGAALVAFPFPALAQLSVGVLPLASTPQPAGKLIFFTATASGGPTGNYIYRFEIAPTGQPYRMMQDYSTRRTITWSELDEGLYFIRVTVRDSFESTETASAVVPFELDAPLTGSAAVAPTTHPLVALYRAPPCLGLVRVDFAPAGSTVWRSTHWKGCKLAANTTFYVAGMRAGTDYQIRHTVWNGESATSNVPLPFETGTPQIQLPFYALTNPPDQTSSLEEDVVIHAMFPLSSKIALPVATDRIGRVTWYLDKRPEWGFSYLTRPVQGGTFLLVNPAGLTSPIGARLIEADLLGTARRETNNTRINEQLAEMGVAPLLTIHHDATPLPNGYIALLGITERDFGAAGKFLGDTVVVLDNNMQVVWAWDSFDHLSVERLPSLGGTCEGIYLQICPGSPEAIDWMHSNSVTYSPADGNLIISVRHQDWVIKVDYQDGAGDGEILWRLGPEGDFTLTNAGDDPFPWQSHQHDARYISNNRIVLYDNGNLRCVDAEEDCYSRGQVYELDEENMEATLILNAELGNYAQRFGSAQILRNGNYNFGSGTILGVVPSGLATEVTPAGEISSEMYVSDSIYRAYRQKSLYIP